MDFSMPVFMWPPLSLRGCSNSCPLSEWCYLTISFSATLFSFCLQSFSASGSIPMSQFFPSVASKYWSFSFNISPSNEYSGLIFFRIDWYDLFAVHGTLKSLPQHRNLKASILWRSAFYITNSHIRMWLVEIPFSSVQLFSRVRLFASPWTAACISSLSFTNSWSLLKLITKSVMPSNQLILCRPLLLLP